MNKEQEKEFLTLYMEGTNNWWKKVGPHLTKKDYDKLKSDNGLIEIRSETIDEQDLMIATVNGKDVDITYACKKANEENKLK